MYFSVSIEMTAAAVGVNLSDADGLMPPFSSERPATIQTESAVRVLKWPKANRPVIGMTAVVSITGDVWASISNLLIFVLISSLYRMFRLSIPIVIRIRFCDSM
ncbi:unknown [Parabacteroides johnsonii CAG:246]|nr:unknown [Parabacteroides johnsonii CAG:246]